MTEKIFGYEKEPVFKEIENHTKALGTRTDCYVQKAFINGFHVDSMIKCRTTIKNSMESTPDGPWNYNFTGRNNSGPNSGGGGGPSNPKPLPKIKEDPTFKKNPCASSILFSLKTGQASYKYDDNSNQIISYDNLTKGILKFFNKSKRFNITYKIGSIKGNGYCNKINNSKFNYEIIIREDYASTATNLSIARTIIHETIHAHLLYVTYGLSYEERKNSKEWIALKEIFDGPLAGDRSNNTIQHEYMTGIVNLISNCLYKWANTNKLNVDKNYCRNLAWGGLQGSQVYKTKVKNRELNNTTITEILLKEQNNQLNAKGTPCTK